MADITTTQRKEVLVYDEEGNQVPIVSDSIIVTGDDPTCIGWSPLYGNGQIDITGEHEGTALINVTLNGSTGTLEVSVTEAEPGELVVTLGPARPK